MDIKLVGIMRPPSSERKQDRQSVKKASRHQPGRREIGPMLFRLWLAPG